MNKLAEILPKAIANAVDRTGGCNAEQMVVNEKIAATKKEEPAPKSQDPTSGESIPERDCIAQLRKLAANYELTPDQIMKYLAANPKVKERFGAIDGVAFADIPDAIVSWLCKGMEKVAAKIKG